MTIRVRIYWRAQRIDGFKTLEGGVGHAAAIVHSLITTNTPGDHWRASIWGGDGNGRSWIDFVQQETSHD